MCAHARRQTPSYNKLRPRRRRRRRWRRYIHSDYAAACQTRMQAFINVLCPSSCACRRACSLAIIVHTYSHALSNCVQCTDCVSRKLEHRLISMRPAKTNKYVSIWTTSSPVRLQGCKGIITLDCGHIGRITGRHQSWDTPYDIVI